MPLRNIIILYFSGDVSRWHFNILPSEKLLRSLFEVFALYAILCKTFKMPLLNLIRESWENPERGTTQAIFFYFSRNRAQSKKFTDLRVAPPAIERIFDIKIIKN